MIPLAVLVAVFAVTAALGAFGVHVFGPWPHAMRYAVLAMFVLTGSAHFTKTRADLVKMVPPGFPNPDAMVAATGYLEIAGGIGMLIDPLRPYAAAGLIAMLVAMFPANVYAARAGLTLNGRPVTPLVPRTAMQLVFIAAVAVAGYLM